MVGELPPRMKQIKQYLVWWSAFWVYNIAVRSVDILQERYARGTSGQMHCVICSATKEVHLLKVLWLCNNRGHFSRESVGRVSPNNRIEFAPIPLFIYPYVHEMESTNRVESFPL